MSTLTMNAKQTYLELANRIDPKGDLATIAEILDENNPMLKDGPAVEANDTFSHSYVRRLSLPTGFVRGLNEGVDDETGQTKKETAELAIIEGRSKNDVKIVDNSPNPKKYRMQMSHEHIEGMSQTHADLLIYGNNSDNPKEINGLATLMGSLATSTNVLSAGGSGNDCTSVYVVQWGVDKTHFLYPRGAKKNVGIDHIDKGAVTVQDANGKDYEAYVDVFTMWTGLCVNNDKCIGRIANIETAGDSNTFDENQLITLLNRMKNGGKGATIYCNSTVKTQMEILLKDKANVYFTSSKGEGLAGEEVLFFRGHPVKLMDAILDTEAAIS